MKKFLLSIIYCYVHCILTAQEKNVFTVDDFVQQVKQFHPVAKQANLITKQAVAAVTAARGNLDPAIMFDASRKTFDGKNYYFYTNPELKIPIWIGADIKAGLESNGGAYLNPEVTSGNTSYMGVEVPLAKGLFMDKRRAAIQQAKIFQSQSTQERAQILNDLLFDAYTTYWQWAGSYTLYNLYNRFLQTASQRFRLVKIAFINGDRSSMDTLEAYTQLQNFEMLQTDAFMKLNDAYLELSTFLWQQNDSAYTLPATFIPDTVRFGEPLQYQSQEELVNTAFLQNPLLNIYNYKLDALQVEKKLKFQNLLPVINAKVNILNREYNVLKGLNAGFIENNYKWGIDFKLPLFLRQGRGDYQKAKLKIEEANYALSVKRRETENKIRSYYNQFTQMQNQLAIMQSAFNNYNILLKQEELRFRNGESSLFIVNSRENKMIEAGQKLVELRIKYQKTYYAVQWAGGLLR
ncbi:TolC family protein [Panacibacter ginsenosidivorans]|nr:TolC family protein [Panacibacter ginsenosidivorans]